MEIQQLRYFVHAACCSSFREAAEGLFVTRAALGKAISTLEAELGQPLFCLLYTSYKEWDLLAPERRAALCFELPDGNDVSVYCRPVGSAPERDELWLQTRVELVCGDVPAPEGYEIVVEGQVRFTNASGDLPASSVQAEADLRMVAGWL